MVFMNEKNIIGKTVKNQAPAQVLQKLEQKLPSNLEETAKRYGALKRRRKIKTAVDLFLAMAMYVIMELSQRLLAATLTNTIGASDQAWQKNFYGASHGSRICWLKQCLNSPKETGSLLADEQSS